MRLVSLLAGFVFVSLAACDSSLGGDLDGTWGWDGNLNPGGSSITLSLSTAGTSVTGSGQVCGIGPACNPGAVTIAGQHDPTFGQFNLTLRGSSGWLVTYAGAFVGHDQLRGSWTEGANSGTVVLDRCPPYSIC